MKNKYEIRGEITAIFMSSKKYGNRETLISTSKLERVKEFPNTWCLHRDSSGNSFYVIGHLPVTNGKREDVSLHRWITNAPFGMKVDHRDHETLNNCDDNLRIATTSENGQNRNKAKKYSETRVVGVSWNTTERKWKGQIRVNKKEIYLGYFTNLKEAEKAVKEARSQYMPYSKEASSM